MVLHAWHVPGATGDVRGCGHRIAELFLVRQFSSNTFVNENAVLRVGEKVAIGSQGLRADSITTPGLVRK